jgi:predicted alpha/beta superfamily hydrolase
MPLQPSFQPETMRLAQSTRRGVAVALFALALLHGTPLAGQESEDIVIGSRFQLNSEILEERRTVEVHLPDNYLDSEEAYPVLVVLDGGRLFKYCVSIVDLMSPNHLPRMIIVGLPSVDRNRDLHPLDARQTEAESGTRRYLRFLHQELFPHLERQYRAIPYRVLTGHSLAGLFAIYTLMEAPGLFDAYIVTSPSLRAPESMELLLNKLRASPTGNLSGKFLYISGGGAEPKSLHFAIQELDAALEAREGEELEHHVEILPGERHVPTKGFYQGLRRLFPAWMPEPGFFENGSLDNITRHYGNLSRDYGFQVLPPPAIITSVGRRLLREEQEAGAVEVYRYYVSLYPRAVSGHLALAEAYSRADESGEAIESLKKALALEPDNERARRMLGELQARTE